MAEQVTIAKLSIDNEKLLKDLAAQKLAVVNGREALKGLKESVGEASVEYQRQSIVLKQAEERYKDTEKTARALASATALEVKTVEEARKALSAVSVLWANQAKLYGENSQEVQELASQKKALTERLKELESATGDNRRNVGNYTEAIITAGKSINDLKEELKQLQQETQSLDVNSQEFKDAQEQAGKLGLTIGQLEGKLDEFGNREPKNPAKKEFEDTLVTVVTLGSSIQLLSDAMGDNEDAQENLAKAVKGVAIAQTVANIAKEKGAIVDTLTLARTKLMQGLNYGYATSMAVVTGATKLFGISAQAAWAAATLGVTAVIAGIVVLIQNFERITNTVRSFLGINESLKSQADRIKKSYESKTKAMEEDIEVMKASGASARELYLAELELNNERIRGLNAIRQKRPLLKEEAEQLHDLAQANKVLNASETKRLADERAEREKARQDAIKDQMQKSIEAKKERERLAQEAKDKAKSEEDAKKDATLKRMQEEIAYYDAFNRSVIGKDKELTLSLIEEERARLQERTRLQLVFLEEQLKQGKITALAYDTAIKEISNSTSDYLAGLFTQLKDNAIKAGEEILANNRANAEKAESDRIARLILSEENEFRIRQIQAANTFELQRLELEHEYIAEIDNAQRIGADTQAIEDYYALKRIQLTEIETRARGEAYANLFGQVSELLGKNTVAGKLAGIAQATINTWLGATEVLKTPSVLPEPAATIQKIVSVATIVASGIKSVKEITSVKVPKLAEGGEVPIGGKRHSQGGTRFWGEDGTQFEAEAGERLFIINRGANNRLEALRQFNSQFRTGAVRGGNYFADGGQVIRGAQDAISQARLGEDIAGALAGVTIVTDVKDIIGEVGRRNQVVDLATV